MIAQSTSRTRRGVATIVLAACCVLASAGGAVDEWSAVTTAARAATRIRGGRGYVALAPKSTSPYCTGTFDVESDGKFVLGEAQGGPARTYTGTCVPRARGEAMCLTLDDAGRAALAEKIGEAASAAALTEWVFVESVAVELKNVSRPVLRRPFQDRTRAATFVASGTYLVTWRYDAGFPFTPYRDVSTWRFTFRDRITVSATHWP